MWANMLTHDQILAVKLIRAPNGAVVDMNPALPVPRLVFTDQSVAPEYYNLLRASQMMYRTIHMQQEALESLVEALEQNGIDFMTPGFVDLQVAMNIAKLTATEGIEKVAEMYGMKGDAK